MKIEDSKYKIYYDKKVSLPSGSFYFFKTFIVSEINEGVHFDWKLAKEVIDLAYQHYGEKIKVVYISNRINSYSVNAQDWLKFYKEKHHLDAFAVVAYTRIGIMNVILEKIFSQAKLKKFQNLDDAIHWAMTLKDSVENKSFTNN